MHDVLRSHWPPRSRALIAEQPRSCCCPYEPHFTATRYIRRYAVYVRRYTAPGCPWHSGARQ